MEATCFFWQHHHHGLLLGIGQQASFECKLQFDATAFQAFLTKNAGNYIFGYLSFDVKNAFENLNSNNPDQLDFPLVHYWVPESLYRLTPTPTLFWGTDSVQNQAEAQALWEAFEQKQGVLDTTFEPRTSKAAYFEHFEQLKDALQRGDIYEVNYCQEFATANCEVNNPVGLFGRLYAETKAPHAAYIQTPDHLVLCASPERFLQKTGNVLRSEPIKGTAPRSKDLVTDQKLARDLQNNPKERAENIMIVDLVRNDLSQVASKNSVGVDELCEIYSFETVHQMISKISCALEPTVEFIDILKACFPMGSMTGAPKIAALEQIERHEDFKRGLYSGSIGLIEPNGDFDFNVVIRSLLYNRNKHYLSCSVGSALTIGANADDEYQECLLKAAKLIHGLR
ncbi:MAG: anthranilate synthase component I family protein [Crocinitomicaceae bacterium]|nr:anthranilate synthase component I family protein [Crocinitomicaceae bacterium]